MEKLKHHAIQLRASMHNVKEAEKALYAVMHGQLPFSIKKERKEEALKNLYSTRKTLEKRLEMGLGYIDEFIKKSQHAERQ